tara:strand:- start:233 stop:694 length:462 start_codon:yes stop_codon:yes gene_type:complete
MLLLIKKNLMYILLALLIVMIDQISKYIIINNIDNLYNVNILLFKINYIKNFGAAFNILSGSRILLSSISIISSIVLLYYIIFLNIEYTKKYALTFILGGTLGNGIDRIINGYVIDFIDLNFINFAVFNIADISINIGLVIFIYILLSKKRFL